MRDKKTPALILSASYEEWQPIERFQTVARLRTFALLESSGTRPYESKLMTRRSKWIGVAAAEGDGEAREVAAEIRCK